VKMHDDIIPHMSHPHSLADLLSGALDRGGMLGMLALHAIFVLVTRHGLEYPAFYARLYQLLQPSTLLVPPPPCPYSNTIVAPWAFDRATGAYPTPRAQFLPRIVAFWLLEHFTSWR